MNTPNKLTLLRILMIPIFMFFILDKSNINIIIAISIFSFAAFTDFLDGYLARKNNQVTTFGKLADPLADKLIVTSAIICFLFMRVGYISPWVVIIIVSREFIVTGIRLIAVGENKIISASSLGKMKTVSQFITIILIMVDMLVPLTILGVNIIIFFVIIMTVLTVISGIDYIKNNWTIFSFK